MTIQNDWVDLKKKWELSKNGLYQFEILHIGDSHLQPNNLSGITRFNLQLENGNAGRGLIFPYNLAKTNGPKDYKFTSNTNWSNNWIIYPKKNPIGLTGISISSEDTKGQIKWKTGKDSLTYPAETGILSYHLSNCKSCLVEVNGVVKKYEAKEAIFDSIQFNITSDSSVISFEGANFTFLDLIEKSNKPGLIYHSTGVAGATFSSYLSNSLFESELKIINPDLIIISLGTNESVSNIKDSVFKKNAIALINIIKDNSPNSEILIVLPNENYIKTKYGWTYNKKIDKVRKILIEICKEKNLNSYDQQIAMGGQGCMLNWNKIGLVNKDHIHFLKNGYKKQGELLFQALSATLLN
jgi:lysophospholipase L1-like esterase